MFELCEEKLKNNNSIFYLFKRNTFITVYIVFGVRILGSQLSIQEILPKVTEKNEKDYKSYIRGLTLF